MLVPPGPLGPIACDKRAPLFSSDTERGRERAQITRNLEVGRNG
jgi:hypothetical protein